MPHTSPPQFLQPQYVSKLLARIASVNEDILSRFSLTPDSTYPLPIPVSLQSNMTLGRLAQTGANDAKASWPIFLALWTELMKPGRPPILLAFDGIQHAMLPTRYVNPDMKRIHALDFSIMAHLVPYLAGLDNDVVASGGIQTQGALPRPANGMLVVAAMSESNRPSTPSLSLAIAQAEMRTHRSRDQLQHRQQQPKQLVAPDSEVDEAASVSSDTSAEPDGGQQFLVDTVGTGSVLADFPSTSRIPEPDPYFKHDDRVLKLMAHVPVVRLRGLSREEARGMLNYHAASGVLRGRVDDRLVGNAWTLSGGGVVGQLEVFTRMKVS